MDTQKECGVCLMEIEGKSISCNNSNCLFVMCSDCLERFIDICNNEKQMPSCVECDYNILFSNLNRAKINTSIVNKYNLACYNYLSRDPEIFKEISSKELQKKYIKDIQNEKIEFMNKTYPKSINLIIELALSDKLKRISNSNKKHIKKITGTLHRRCFSPVCYKGLLNPGKELDTHFTCNTCEMYFCKTCEKSLTKRSSIKSHTCNKDDLLSIESIKAMVKCPKCKVPCEKISGCNFITCAICHTNFHCIDGKATSQGNHDNIKINVKSNNNYNLLSIIKDIDNDKLRDLVIQFSNNEPKKTFYKTYLKKYTTLITSLAEETVPEVKKEKIMLISKYYSRYKTGEYESIQYNRYSRQIYDSVVNSELTIDFMKSILNRYTSET